jgi:hypothetical protein
MDAEELGYGFQWRLKIKNLALNERYSKCMLN